MAKIICPHCGKDIYFGAHIEKSEFDSKLDQATKAMRSEITDLRERLREAKGISKKQPVSRSINQ